MKLIRDENGATAAEYAVLASLIAATIFGVVTLFGEAVIELFAPITIFFTS